MLQIWWMFLEQVTSLPGHSEESLAAVTPCRLQLCPILGSSTTKLSGHYYVCSMRNSCGPRDPGFLSEEYPFYTFPVGWLELTACRLSRIFILHPFLPLLFFVLLHFFLTLVTLTLKHWIHLPQNGTISGVVLRYVSLYGSDVFLCKLLEDNITYTHSSSYSYFVMLTHWGRGHLNCLNASSRGF